MIHFNFQATLTNDFVKCVTKVHSFESKKKKKTPQTRRVKCNGKIFKMRLCAQSIMYITKIILFLKQNRSIFDPKWSGFGLALHNDIDVGICFHHLLISSITLDVHLATILDFSLIIGLFFVWKNNVKVKNDNIV